MRLRRYSLVWFLQTFFPRSRSLFVGISRVQTNFLFLKKLPPLFGVIIFIRIILCILNGQTNFLCEKKMDDLWIICGQFLIFHKFDELNNYFFLRHENAVNHLALLLILWSKTISRCRNLHFLFS